MTDPTTQANPEPDSTAAPLQAYRSALRRLDGPRLREILGAIGREDRPGGPGTLADAVADRLTEPRVAGGLVAGLASGPRLALALYALTETSSWPATGLAHALGCLGVEASAALAELLGLGLLAPRADADGPVAIDPARPLGADGEGGVGIDLLAHPAALAVARTVRPEVQGPPAAGPARQVREADGLEPILRLAGLWQRVAEAPLRQTQQGPLYKRDRDRLEDDPLLAGPIADSLEPLPDMVPLWLTLARGVGLIQLVPGSDRIVAAPAGYWAENSVHLPQMIASRWLALRTWHEQGGMSDPGGPVVPALPFTRPAILLWLSAMAEEAWLALDDLAEHLRLLRPGWDRLALAGPEPTPVAPRAKSARGQSADRTARPRPDSGALEAVLLGPAYQLGLVRAAEEVPSGRRLVQLTPLGRYALALGPPAPPRPAFEHFLFVQPNFEIIAYRQGLTPSLIGQFSRFARWSQVGAALELKLTPESIYRGLEGNLTPEQMLDRLGRHSARPLPIGVAEALRTWADRRDRLTYYASATLIEFASPEALAKALAAWSSTGRAAPIRVSDRLLLVEDEAAIPFQRFRLAGARDYRRSPEACVDVEPDGVTLALDLGRSDLLVDAELARFADELPPDGHNGPSGAPRRRFRVSPASLARAAEIGLTPAKLARWFPQRAGADIPAALRLLLHAASPRAARFKASRPLILSVPGAELLDGLAQHPATRDLLGERLGPAAVVVPDHALDDLRRALAGLGLALDDLSEPQATPDKTLRIKRP